MRPGGSEVEKRLKAVFLAFGSGLLVIVLAVAWLDSRALVGAALVWILGVMLFAVRAFRCPLCGATLLFFPIQTAWRWIRASPRKCPRCRTDYDDAVAELARGKGRSS